MITRTFKIYGLPGHRQRESFFSSIEPTPLKNGVVLEQRNADKTGTNEYSELILTAKKKKDIFAELDTQIYDGAFETSRIGAIYCVEEKRYIGFTEL